jgi:hypothetical protein
VVSDRAFSLQVSDEVKIAAQLFCEEKPHSMDLENNTAKVKNALIAHGQLPA